VGRCCCTIADFCLQSACKTSCRSFACHSHTCWCRLASKILKITQAHTKEAAAKSWRRNNLEAMEMPVDDEDESDSGEVGREEEYAQRLKRKAKEEQVHSPLVAPLRNVWLS
jgi:hypothetical protein